MRPCGGTVAGGEQGRKRPTNPGRCWRARVANSLESEARTAAAHHGNWHNKHYDFPPTATVLLLWSLTDRYQHTCFFFAIKQPRVSFHRSKVEQTTRQVSGATMAPLFKCRHGAAASCTARHSSAATGESPAALSRYCDPDRRELSRGYIKRLRANDSRLQRVLPFARQCGERPALD
jgi:hypothetical protein